MERCRVLRGRASHSSRASRSLALFGLEGGLESKGGLLGRLLSSNADRKTDFNAINGVAIRELGVCTSHHGHPAERALPPDVEARTLRLHVKS